MIANVFGISSIYRKTISTVLNNLVIWLLELLFCVAEFLRKTFSKSWNHGAAFFLYPVFPWQEEFHSQDLASGTYLLRELALLWKSSHKIAKTAIFENHSPFFKFYLERKIQWWHTMFSLGGKKKTKTKVAKTEKCLALCN